MTFEEWWETVDKDFSDWAITDEIKWFSEKAWNKAVNVTIEKEEKSFFRFCENPDCRHFRN